MSIANLRSGTHTVVGDLFLPGVPKIAEDMALQRELNILTGYKSGYIDITNVCVFDPANQTAVVNIFSSIEQIFKQDTIVLARLMPLTLVNPTDRPDLLRVTVAEIDDGQNSVKLVLSNNRQTTVTGGCSIRIMWWIASF